MIRYSRIAAAVAALLLLLLAGCADFKMRGSVEEDRDVAASFRSFEHRPDMNYYSSGPDAHPNALMGLNKDYALEPGLWKKVNSADELKAMVWGMNKNAREMYASVRGFRILDNEGKPIGIWYSHISHRAMLIMKGDRKVLVYTPDIRRADP
ncbi:MAG: hypothetical protein RBT20_09985 [Syntrophales bacterium]|jgi:hypothetical protein|nr:hypothetical protein [Syntrophales bacterium]